MQITFSGIKSQYKTKQADIFPVMRDITPTDITKICKSVEKSNFIGEGFNGEVFILGKDLVIKKSKRNALVNTDVLPETRKLNMLYNFAKENGVDLQNTQRGIASFKLKNGDSYLISTFVRGSEINPYNNPFNKKNLESMMKILISLDKGSKKYGRLLVFDYNLGNINFTKDKAGIFDVEYMRGEPLEKGLKNIIEQDYDATSSHISDTSSLQSNIKSFEWAAINSYMKMLPKTETKKFFTNYLHIKSNYHNEMSKFYEEKSYISKYSDLLKDIALSEKIHSKLLGKKNIDNDILKSEAIKIQMAYFVFTSSKWCNASYSKFSLYQVMQYYEKGISYFKSELAKAENTNNQDKITYYNNCLNMFYTWKHIKELPKTMKDSQKIRLWDLREKTLDELL